MDAITAEALKASPFFAGLDDADLDRIAAIGEHVHFEAGQPIVERGDKGDAMFVLLEGTAEIEVGGRVHKPGPGQAVGEMALFSRKPRTATAKALEPVSALRIAAEGFHDFLLENPRIAVTMLEQVVERLREVQARVEAYWS